MVVPNMGKRKTNSRKKAQTLREIDIKKEIPPTRSDAKVISPRKNKQEGKSSPKKSAYASLNFEEIQQFNTFQYWREPLPDIMNLKIDDEMPKNNKETKSLNNTSNEENASFTEFSSFYYWKDPLPSLSSMEISHVLAG